MEMIRILTAFLAGASVFYLSLCLSWVIISLSDSRHDEEP